MSEMIQQNPWKLVFMDGVFSKEHSALENLPAGVSVHTNDGVSLHVKKNITVASPIHLLFVNVHHPLRNTIVVEEGADVTLLEEYVSDKENATQTVTEIHSKSNAYVRHYKLQDENSLSTHQAKITVHQEQDSQVSLFNLSQGAKQAREEIFVDLTARGAECHLLGLYGLHGDEQHNNHHLHVNHAAEYTTSSMLYKGILDKKSQAGFTGKVHVHPQAQHTNSYQANHNLLLSKFAEVNTRPELEIYANDVKCTHGATVGQLETEALFYLRSRGIDKETALRLLIEAFADEVMSKIPHVEIRNYLQKRVKNNVEL